MGIGGAFVTRAMHGNGTTVTSPRKSQLSEWGIYGAEWGFGSVKNAPYVGEGLIGCDKSPPCPHITRGGGVGHRIDRCITQTHCSPSDREQGSAIQRTAFS